MKGYRTALLIALTFLTGCATATPQDDSWFGRDKAKHFLASGLISGTATVIADKQGMNRDESFYFAFGTTLSLGAGKEAYDLKIRKTGWSWKDLFWDALGALAGYGIVQAVD
ncbi:MAG: hypothetical protein C4581_06770 [Nitrospiraceae bacterium]|nr:MAG: hypothetical protein C4581_06770 [Nitrospiraceae bacterium]